MLAFPLHIYDVYCGSIRYTLRVSLITPVPPYPRLGAPQFYGETHLQKG